MTEARKKIRHEPPGQILGIAVGNIQKDRPQRIQRGHGRWARVYAQFDALPIIDANTNTPGEVLIVTLENASDANRMNSSIHGYAEVRNCRTHGWKVRQETHPPDENGHVRAILWKQQQNG